MTLVAAAVCPHPPILIPEVGRAEPVAAREPALAAARRLCAARPDLIVVVGDDSAAAEYDERDAGSFAGFGVDLQVPLGPGEPARPPRLPLSLTVGAWLLRQVGWPGRRIGRGVPADTTPAAAAALGAELVRAAEAAGERLGLLVMGDGSARRTQRAPGYLDERAEPFDASAAAALSALDPAALLALDPALAAELLAAGRASWQVLAGAVLAATGAGTGPGAPARGSGGVEGWKSDLVYNDAPFGVGYLVAVWERVDLS